MVIFIVMKPTRGLIVEGIDSLILGNEELNIKTKIANRIKGISKVHFTKSLFLGATYNPTAIQIVAAI